MRDLWMSVTHNYKASVLDKSLGGRVLSALVSPEADISEVGGSQQCQLETLAADVSVDCFVYWSCECRHWLMLIMSHYVSNRLTYIDNVKHAYTVKCSIANGFQWGTEWEDILWFSEDILSNSLINTNYENVAPFLDSCLTSEHLRLKRLSQQIRVIQYQACPALLPSVLPEEKRAAKEATLSLCVWVSLNSDIDREGHLGQKQTGR